MKEESVKIPFGFSLVLLSAVPMNVGIGSSAAVEIGTLACLNGYLGLGLGAERIAQLGQMAENHVVGAPAGSWTRSPSPAGAAGNSPTSSAGPERSWEKWKSLLGTGFIGINSMVRHSVGGSPYSDTRIGAFIGKKIINDLRERKAQPPLNYLTEMSVADLRRDYAAALPETVIGSEFITAHKTHGDPVTTIQPDAVYRVAGPTRHPVEENERVLTFMEALACGQGRQRRAGHAQGRRDDVRRPRELPRQLPPLD